MKRPFGALGGTLAHRAPIQERNSAASNGSFAIYTVSENNAKRARALPRVTNKRGRESEPAPNQETGRDWKRHQTSTLKSFPHFGTPWPDGMYV